ncbi:MAG: PAC2 family protein, partial [Candidatus Methanomethyliaceae archaeon]|nr:PAC2 family protein [Candidatus Methanomethyliaceae archaeon]
VELYNSDNFVFITGNAQPATPEGQHELTDFIVKELQRKYGISKIYAMAAYVVEGRVGEPKIYGAVTDLSLMKALEGFGVIPMSGGSISGANGIILTYAKEYEIPAACLLSETLAYTYGYFADVKAAEALVKVIQQLLE